MRKEVFECEIIHGLSENFMKLYTSHIKQLRTSHILAQDEKRLRIFKVAAQFKFKGDSKFVSLIPATSGTNATTKSNNSIKNVLMHANTKFHANEEHTIKQLLQDQACVDDGPMLAATSTLCHETPDDLLQQLEDRDDILDEVANLVPCCNCHYCIGSLTPPCVSEQPANQEARVE